MGITSDERDLSVDLIRTVTLPHLSLFGIEGGGAQGTTYHVLPFKYSLLPCCRLKGEELYLWEAEVEFMCPVVKQIKTLNFVDPGKSIEFVELHMPCAKEDSGKSPGFGMSLVATSTTASRALLEIQRGGCVDRHHQWLILLFMVLGSEDIGRCRMGELTVRSVQLLRDIKQFFGTSFKITPAPDSENELMLSCFGTGYINSNKAVS
ncbi:RNA 3'-terminal phosphate cyclase-like protein [Ceratobasidium sp. AG-Ba]|nr:RNA 3'-terminal phosphate cyclase-like protein [Ceratobasidium sp. AG-Ba]